MTFFLLIVFLCFFSIMLLVLRVFRNKVSIVKTDSTPQRHRRVAGGFDLSYKFMIFFITAFSFCLCANAENSFVKDLKSTPQSKPLVKKALEFKRDASIFTAGIFFWPEFFYGKNLTLLNDNNIDEVLYFRHFIDLTGTYTYMRPSMSTRSCTECNGKHSAQHHAKQCDATQWKNKSCQGVSCLSVDQGEQCNTSDRSNIEDNRVNSDPEPYPLLKAKCTVRTRTVWGVTAGVLETLDNTIKEMQTVFGAHRHALFLSDLWVRELWLEGSLNDLLCIPWCNYHTFTIGAFPFELGRGIALGYGYPSTPPVVGFYIEEQVDQFAWGAKVSGALIKDELSYDIYGSVLSNRCATFDQTNANTRSHHYGHKHDGARGFGFINYLVAGRLKWFPHGWNPHIKRETKVLENATKNVDECNDCSATTKLMYLEPYVLYNFNPDIRIEELNNAVSNLITCGFMAEFAFGSWEFGFETAFNAGSQDVAGFDRNKLILTISNESKPRVAGNRHDDKTVKDQLAVKVEKRATTEESAKSADNQIEAGTVVVANDQVLDTLTHSDALVTPQNQPVIALAPRTQQQNGKFLNDHLKNSRLRFQDPYRVRYRGLFFVADGSYIWKKGVFKMSAAFGIATGDSDPRLRASFLPPSGDRTLDYDGFIAINETYAGKRVSSMLFFNGFATFPRIIDFGADALNPNSSVLNATGFTNLVYFGISADYHYKPKVGEWRINPNILWYRQENTSAHFKLLKGAKSLFPEFINEFLGTELNLLAEKEFFTDATFFIAGGLFVPGHHFSDLRRHPINEQQKAFKKHKKGHRLPLIGDDCAYLINIGFKCTF